MNDPMWVIVGVELNGRPAIMASQTLTRAQLEYEVEIVTSAWDVCERPTPRDRRIAMTLVMNDYVLIVANTYRQALTDLLTAWQPDQLQRSSRPELTAT